MKKWISPLVGLLGLLVSLPSLQAQAVYTASRAGRIQAGAGLLYLKSDFIAKGSEGISVWADYDLNRLLGAEVEAHFGGLRSPGDIGENSYLIGPRVSYHRRKLSGYGKIMVGRGTIMDQFLHTSSTFNLYAFGGGLDYRIRPRFNIRVIDFEQQKWPNFEPHTLSPINISAGLMYIIR